MLWRWGASISLRHILQLVRVVKLPSAKAGSSVPKTSETGLKLMDTQNMPASLQLELARSSTANAIEMDKVTAD